ncbi:signal peptidase II [Acidithiobacillus ferrianus]|uniref:signal peptidase II n=1 Tax=Acidithiobacillus ferrianus TaxID=2678518 RepID=UPI0034E5C0E9
MPMLRMIVSALIAFSLNRFSEVVIIYWLDLASVHTIHVWPPYLNFVMAWNTGIDFGFLSNYGGRWLFVAFPIAVSLGLIAWVRNKRGWILPLATGAVVGGALGNAFDRVAYGAVADYLNMSCCGINNPYSFNVADVLITCGTVFIVIGHKIKLPLPSASSS